MTGARPGDLVVDCFGGSTVTGRVCEDLGRRWLIAELDEDYLRGSAFRFNESELLTRRLPSGKFALEGQERPRRSRARPVAGKRA